MSSQYPSHRLSSSRRQVVAEIVRLVTPDYPKLEEPERARVLASVTSFVSSQIDAMPSFIALPYRIAISLFQLLPVLRYGRGFKSLDDDTKESYLAIWSDATIGPFGDFIKLIRSCALLAYFDHPDVTRRLPAMQAGAAVVAREAPLDGA